MKKFGRVWLVLMATVVAACSVLALLVYANQVHHNETCSTYEHALRGAVSDPIDPIDTNGLSPRVATVARDSARAYRAQNPINLTAWDHYANAFVAADLSAAGC